MGMVHLIQSSYNTPNLILNPDIKFLPAACRTEHQHSDAKVTTGLQIEQNKPSDWSTGVDSMHARALAFPSTAVGTRKEFVQTSLVR